MLLCSYAKVGAIDSWPFHPRPRCYRHPRQLERGDWPLVVIWPPVFTWVFLLPHSLPLSLSLSVATFNLFPFPSRRWRRLDFSSICYLLLFLSYLFIASEIHSTGRQAGGRHPVYATHQLFHKLIYFIWVILFNIFHLILTFKISQAKTVWYPLLKRKVFFKIWKIYAISMQSSVCCKRKLRLYISSNNMQILYLRERWA